MTISKKKIVILKCPPLIPFVMVPTSPYLIASVLGLVGVAAGVSLSVASTGGNATSPFQYGIMFEDISHSGDGGM